MFTRPYYRRRNDETLLRFVIRYVIGGLVVLTVVAPPTMAIKAYLKGLEILPYLGRNLPSWYIAVPIAAVVCALYRGTIKNDTSDPKKEKQS